VKIEKAQKKEGKITGWCLLRGEFPRQFRRLSLMSLERVLLFFFFPSFLSFLSWGKETVRAE